MAVVVTSSDSIIARFARHNTAANLLMAILVLVGVFALTKLNRQIFPDFEIPIITISIPWPGASAEDIEKGILDVVEPELRFLDAAEKVRSTAKEGQAFIFMEFAPTADMQKAQADVEQALSTITTLPEEAERPQVTRAALYEPVLRLSVSGPFTEQALKSYAKLIRDGLLNAGIDKVDIRGARDEEIWVSIREADLRRFDLSLEDVAKRIRDNTEDKPAGILSGASESQLRTKSDREAPRDIGKIEIKSLSTGEKIYLKDIATVNTHFAREGTIGLSRGQQAIEVVVKRALTADTVATMRLAQSYIKKVRQQLPRSLRLEVYDLVGRYVEQRLGILIWNGLQGLALVLIALFMFLHVRIAFWTAAGIPIAIFATLGVMWLTGQSLNMISMFALIMMLGIIVDDAIVVGEHTAALEEGGVPRSQAAEQGAMRMFAPVTAAILTTAASFLPIFFIGDRVGDIMRSIPLVVLAALFASMVECFLIMPGHLHYRGRKTYRPSKLRKKLDGGFEWFRVAIFQRSVGLAFQWRYTTIAVMIACLIVAFGALAGERVRFLFFPQMEPENVMASVNFAPGVPRDQQFKAITRIEAALYSAEKELRALGSGAAEKELVQASFAILGQAGRETGTNLAEVSVQLTASEERTVRTPQIIAAWRKALPTIPGVQRIAVYGRRGGPPGRDVDVRLTNGSLATLKDASEELMQKLQAFKGIAAIEDDLPYGKQELVFALKPRGTSLGFTAAMVGQQVRNAFEGAIATRFARGDEEITVRVLRSHAFGGIAALYSFYLRTPTGGRVALTDVVDVTERQTFALIQRREGKTTVSITADVDDKIASTTQVVNRLEQHVMPALAQKYGITYSYGGRAEELKLAFADLMSGAVVAMVIIYIILAWVFASYTRPLAVMAIVPFGFIGAIGGALCHGICDDDALLNQLLGSHWHPRQRLDRLSQPPQRARTTWREP